MAKPGPAKAPNALRLLRGDKNPNRFNAHEPMPPAGDMAPPAGLDLDVARVWAERLTDLQAMGLAFPSDVDTWRCFCEAVVIHEKACEVMARSPILVKGLHGGLVRNPALQIQRDAALNVARFGSLFGLNPSARSTVEAKRADLGDVNPFAGVG